MDRCPFVLPFAAFGALSVGSARAQEVLQEWFGDPYQGAIGHSVASFPDLDGDGVREIGFTADATFAGELRSGATGVRLFRFSYGVKRLAPLGDLDGDGLCEIGNSDGVVVIVHKGKDGQTLLKIDPTTADYFGPAMEAFADVTGDKVPDFLVGTPTRKVFTPDAGSVSIVSGKNGTESRIVRGTKAGDRFGSAIAVLPDLTGDGIADFAAGAPTGAVTGGSFGYVRACSSSSGATLWQLDGTSLFPGFGRALAPTGDRDGDGLDDLLVSSRGDANGTASGRVWIVSSATGLEITHLDGPAGFDVAVDLDDAGDVDGDAVRDLLFSTQVDQAWLVSGRTLQSLYTFEDDGCTMTGRTVGAAGDFDGDGRADVIVAALGSVLAGNGQVAVHGGDDLFLDLTPIDATAGDTLTASVRTGVPGNPVLLVVVDANGSPVWWPIDGLLAFDPLGSLDLSDVAPSGLAGNVYALQAFALDGAGKLIRTERETLAFH